MTLGLSQQYETAPFRLKTIDGEEKMSKYERDGGYLNQTDTKLFVLFLLDELSYPLTEQVLTPSTAETAFSTRALQAAQLMPVTL